VGVLANAIALLQALAPGPPALCVRKLRHQGEGFRV
jgi:hypothetical protein